MHMMNRHFQMVVFLLIMGLFLPGSSVSSNGPADMKSGEVEVVIRNSTFEFHGGILKPDEAATIILRNQDSIQHGFTSVLLEDLDVQVEADGVVTLGKQIRSVHINPGKTVQFHFIPTRPGKFSFRCDLHPAMKGELLLLSMGSL